MKKTIEDLLSGKYEYRKEGAVLSEAKVEAATAPERDYRGFLTVRSADGSKIRGFGSVTDARIVLARDRFSGTEFRVEYGIDVRGLSSGDSVSGDIVLSLSCGEYVIPVFLSVRSADGAEREAGVTSLDTFAEYAKNNFADAFRMFSGARFESSVLAEESGETRALYRSLTVNPVTYQRLEEFFILTGKKKPIEYTAYSGETSFSYLKENREGTLSISKNTWGNVNLQAEASGDFIAIPQKHFLEDDFVGNRLDFRYEILSSRIGENVRRGRIVLHSDTNDIVLKITASKRSCVPDEERRSYLRSVAAVQRSLLEFFLGKISGTELMKRSVPSIYTIRRIQGDRADLTLLEAYEYYAIGAASTAAGILKKLDGHSFEDETASTEALYDFLAARTGVNPTAETDLYETVYGLWREEPDSLVILRIMMELDTDLKNRPGFLLTRLSEIYRGGSRQPFLFYLAYRLMEEHEEQLRSLTAFTKHVLAFAVHYKILTHTLALKAAVLSENEKTFSGLMYRILAGACGMYPDDEILEALLKLLIRGNPRDLRYYDRFSQGVERGVRITRIYEYYMETLPEGYRRILPEKVLRYFAMNNTLSENRKALLYANIIWNKEYDRPTYSEYEQKMRAFAHEMLEKEAVSEDLAVLYHEFITTLPNEETAHHMSAIMFRCVIVSSRADAREAAVLHPDFKEEVTSPMYRGKAFADIYSKDAVIVFEDERGRRFRSDTTYSVRYLMDFRAYLDRCRELGIEDRGIAEYRLRAAEFTGVNKENIRDCLYIAGSEEFSDGCRAKMISAILNYYAENDSDDSFGIFLEKVGMERIAAADSTLLTELLVTHGMHRDAFRYACRYGYENIEAGLLMRLASRMIDLYEFREDEELLLMAVHAYRENRYDERTIAYLEKYFTGSVREMSAVRVSASRFLQDTYELDERILKLSMFTGVRPENGAEILKSYTKQGGSEKVRLAWLDFEAAACFSDGVQPDPYVVQCFENDYDGKQKLDFVTRLCLLKYYAGRKEIGGEASARRDRIFGEAVRRGYVFAFYRKLPQELLSAYQLDDKMIIEYHGYPTDRVFIHYRNSSEEEKVSVSDPMKRMYGGIFTASCVMFGSEVLRYHITVVRRDGTTETEEMSEIMNAPERGGRSRYNRINELISEKKQGRTEAFRETLRKVRLADHAVRELFPLTESTDGAGDGEVRQ